MNNKESFGKRLSRLRKRMGYSQAALAERIDTTRRIICYYECEADRPPVELLPRLAEVLQVSVDTLLGTIEPKQDGRTIDSKFWPKWEQLAPEDKKVISKMADTLLEKNRRLVEASQ